MADVKSTPGLRIEQFEDPQLQRFQTAMAAATQNARTCPLVNGRAIAVSFVSGVQQDIPHGLGRSFASAFLLVGFGYVSISFPATQLDATKYISLIANATANVAIWVF